MPTRTVTTLSSESIDKYRAWLSARGLSERTAVAYATDLRMLLEEIERDHLPMEEFEEIAQDWLTWNRRRLAPKTTSRRLTSARGFAKWAGLGVILEDYVAPHAGTPIPHPLPEGLDGVRRMIAEARTTEQSALVAFCGFIGTRVHEARAARPSHFDLINMELKILGKGDKVRYVPVSEEAWGVLAAPVTAAFLNNDALIVPLHDRVARGNITQMGRRAGLQRPVSSHDLRATFATAVYDKTKDMRLVQELLGHSSVETTQVYVGVRRKALHDAVNL